MCARIEWMAEAHPNRMRFPICYVFTLVALLSTPPIWKDYAAISSPFSAVFIAPFCLALTRRPNNDQIRFFPSFVHTILVRPIVSCTLAAITQVSPTGLAARFFQSPSHKSFFLSPRWTLTLTYIRVRLLIMNFN